jgi:uncharacterized protein (TIGR03083 family)
VPSSGRGSPATDLPEAAALLASLPTAAALVRRPEVAAAWATPSDLPGYSVGGVAGHLVRAAGRLEQVLDMDPPTGDDAEFTDWYLANRVATPEDLGNEFARFLVDDGEGLAAEGPAALAEELGALAARLPDRLAAEDAERRVNAIRTPKPVKLADYLASRVLEVVVHADDVATGAGIEAPDFATVVGDTAAGFLLRLARSRSGDVAVLRAFTRSDRVADPYDVLRVL